MLGGEGLGHMPAGRSKDRRKRRRRRREWAEEEIRKTRGMMGRYLDV